MDSSTDPRKSGHQEMAGCGTILGVALLAIGVLISLTGFFALGGMLLVAGAVFTFGGLASAGVLVADSDAAKKVVAGTKQAVSGAANQTDRWALHARATRVTKQLYDQMLAGAISQAEYDQRIAQVNAKLEQDYKDLDAGH